MLERYALAEGRLLRDPAGTALLVFVGPDEAEKASLVADFGLDPHDLASALDPEELGRVEIEGAKARLILKVPRNFTGEDQLLFTVTSMGLFLDARRLLLVTTDPVELFKERGQGSPLKGPKDILLRLLSGIVSHFHEHLKVINMLSESLERRVRDSMGNRYLLDMFTLEKSLVYFLNGIGSNQLVIDRLLASSARLKLGQAREGFLEDVAIENRQCLKQAEIYSDILTGLMDARGSVVNNNVNLLMKRLTVISVIFMPLNVLAGMGGMSEFSALIRGRLPWYLGYGLFLLLLVGVGSATSWILRRSGAFSEELRPERGGTRPVSTRRGRAR